MGKWRQITTGADRAAHRAPRGVTPVIEHRDKQVHYLEPDAGVAACQAIRQQDHDGTCGGNVKRLAYAAGMATDEITLQIGELRLMVS